MRKEWTNAIPEDLLSAMRNGDPALMNEPIIVNGARIRMIHADRQLQKAGVYTSLILQPSEELLLTGVVARAVSQMDTQATIDAAINTFVHPMFKLFPNVRTRYMRVLIDEIIGLRTIGNIISCNIHTLQETVPTSPPVETAITASGVDFVQKYITTDPNRAGVFTVDASGIQDWLHTWNQTIAQAREHDAPVVPTVQTHHVA